MIEVYVLLTLSALGYLLNKTSNNIKKTNNNVVNLNEMPSMKNIYDSKYLENTDNKLKQKASKKFIDSKEPNKTNVISYNYNLMNNKSPEVENEKVMSLSGEYINKSEFTHGNMVPYYGGSIKQNMDDNSNRVLLENFTGITDLKKNKCETASFYDKSKNVTNVNGMQNQDDFFLDRIVAPIARNNEFPIPQTHVGPGLGEGYSSTPTGGFQQFNSQEYAQDKCVDQLRTKLNPSKNALGISDTSKETYSGRTLDGLKTGLRGKIGQFNKNHVETFYEQTPDMLLKTTGANLKPTKYGKFDVKETNRLTTTKEQIGTAYASSRLARKLDPNVRKTFRQEYKGNFIGGASLDKYGLGNKDDFGKSRIMVYNNERDITSTRVYQGNVTSIIKAIIAPIEDMIKVTKKQHNVDNPRHFGNMSIQIPNKQTIYDPNDIAKTTIKETTIHDAILSNFKGSTKITIYDPNDITRTTLKETTLHDAILSNLKGNTKITIYDPNDIARTTIKETTIHDYTLGNLKGHEQLTIYDPNDIARTTIKETLIHDEIGTGTLTGAKQLYIYDPDEIARKTIRETVDRMDYEMNIAPVTYKGVIYDPDDITRKTIKETTVDREREFGNINSHARGGAYETTEYDAKHVQKEIFSDIDYYGGAVRDAGEGYITNKMDARDTQKQFLSDIEYFGIAEAGADKKQMSYDEYFNATISEQKESTLASREPTKTGVKQFNDCINVAMPRKQECDLKTERIENNRDRIYNEVPSLSDKTITKTRKNIDYEIDDRLDISLLDAFKENEFTQPLNSAV